MKQLRILLIMILLLGLNNWILSQESEFIQENPMFFNQSDQSGESTRKISGIQTTIQAATFDVIATDNQLIMNTPIIIKATDFTLPYSLLHTAIVYDGTTPLPTQADDLNGDGIVDEVVFQLPTTISPSSSKSFTMTVEDVGTNNGQAPNANIRIAQGLYNETYSNWLPIGHNATFINKTSGKLADAVLEIGEVVWVETDSVILCLYISAIWRQSSWKHIILKDDNWDVVAAKFNATADWMWRWSRFGYEADYGWHTAAVPDTVTIANVGPVRAVIQTISGIGYNGVYGVADDLRAVRTYTIYSGFSGIAQNFRLTGGGEIDASIDMGAYYGGPLDFNSKFIDFSFDSISTPWPSRPGSNNFSYVYSPDMPNLLGNTSRYHPDSYYRQMNLSKLTAPYVGMYNETNYGFLANWGHFNYKDVLTSIDWTVDEIDVAYSFNKFPLEGINRILVPFSGSATGGDPEGYMDTLNGYWTATPEVVNTQAYFERGPITITSDSQLNASFPGKGTKDNPIQIDGYNITASSGTLISISDTTFYFRIVNCLLDGLTTASQGIYFSNVYNGTIINNTISYCGKGIELTDSSNNTIDNNTVYNNIIDDTFGIDLNHTSNITITNNKIFNTGHDAIRMWNSDNNTFINNTIHNNKASGFSINTATNIKVLNNQLFENEYGMHTYLFNYSLMSGNIIYNNSQRGMNFWECVNNTISNNTFYNQGYESIGVYYADNFKISNNSFYNNSGTGIILSSSENNNLTTNKVYDNDGLGIRLESSADTNYIAHNIVHDNVGVGISLLSSSKNALYNNSVYDNQGSGFWLESSSNNNTIDHNNISSNLYAGVGVSSSENTTIIFNRVHDNEEHGISISDSSHLFIANNTVYDNSKNGILFGTVVDCIISNNTNYGNNWDGFGINYLDKSTISNNTAYGNGAGFTFAHCDSNTVIDNTAYGNNLVTGYGIWLYNSTNNVISSNYVFNNAGNGIQLVENSKNNTISSNTVYNNAGDGIHLDSSNFNRIDNNNVYNSGFAEINLRLSSNNTVSSNNVRDNRNAAGIYIVKNDYNNTISNNNVYNNSHGIRLEAEANMNWIMNNAVFDNGAGIYLEFAKNNTIMSNIVRDNDVGITIVNGDELGHSKYNTISQNLIYDNQGYGVVLMSMSSQNQIKNNDFHENNAGESQATDGGSNNVFSSNYWSDWTGTGSYAIHGSVGNEDTSPSVNSHHLSAPVITAPTSVTTTLKDSVILQWTASSDTFGHSFTYSVYYSTDDGVSWVELASGLNTLKYTWDVTSLYDGTTVLLKVEVIDSIGFRSYSISTKDYTIDNPGLTHTTTTTPESTTTTTPHTTTEPTLTVSTSGMTAFILLLALISIFGLRKKRRP